MVRPVGLEVGLYWIVQAVGQMLAHQRESLFWGRLSILHFLFPLHFLLLLSPRMPDSVKYEVNFSTMSI